jgi:hypothetical protein
MISAGYHILSLKWSRDGVITWWQANNSGYTTWLENAGVYTAEQVAAKPDYYNDGESALAVPVSAIAEMRQRTIVEMTFENLRIARDAAPSAAARRTA